MRRSLPWFLWGVVFLLCVAALVVAVVWESATSQVWGVRGSTGAWALGFSTVGVVLATRRPGNPIGWLLLVGGVFAGFETLVLEVGLSRGPDRDLVELAKWATSWGWIPAVGALAAALFLFPTGQPASPVWRRVAVGHAVLTVVATVGVVLAPDHDGIGLVQQGPLLAPSAALEQVVGVVVLAWQVVLLAAFVSIASRFRRADAVTRLQLRWVATATGAVVASAAVVEVGGSLDLLTGRAYYLGSLVLSLAIVLVPVAIGIAVLRYRLYEIDRIIGRTVVYGVVTATLGGLYLLVIIVFQLVFTARSTTVPPTVVAATTLVVGAAFAPLRRRVRRLVDRRFNRRLVDGRATIDEFGHELRDAVDDRVVVAHLRDVSRELVAPAHVSVWVRPD